MSPDMRNALLLAIITLNIPFVLLGTAILLGRPQPGTGLQSMVIGGGVVLVVALVLLAVSSRRSGDSNSRRAKETGEQNQRRATIAKLELGEK